MERDKGEIKTLQIITVSNRKDSQRKRKQNPF